MFNDFIPISKKIKIHSILLNDKLDKLPFVLWASLESKQALSNIFLSDLSFYDNQVVIKFFLDQDREKLQGKESLYFYQENVGHLFKAYNLRLNGHEVSCTVDHERFYIKEHLLNRRAEFHNTQANITLFRKGFAKKLKVSLFDINDIGVSFMCEEDHDWLIGQEYIITHLHHIELPKHIHSYIHHVSRIGKRPTLSLKNEGFTLQKKNNKKTKFHIGLKFHEKNPLIQRAMAIYTQK